MPWVGNFAMRGRPAAERFWAKVDKNGPMPTISGWTLGVCWLWTAAKNHHGYGKFNFNGKYYGAHVAAWILETDQIPSQCMLHRCDNPSCVRKSHLYEGTMQDNTQDMITKGRRGSCGTKLSDAQVAEIRDRHCEHGENTVTQHNLPKNTASVLDLFR